MSDQAQDAHVSDADDAQDATSQDDAKASAQDATPTGFDALPKETQDEIRSLRRENAKYRTEMQKRKDAEAEAQGKWQELAEQREAELTKTTTDLEAATGELEALRGYFDAEYTASVKALPDVIRAFQPGDDASFATKSVWLKTAKEQAAALEKQAPRGNGPGPKPGRQGQISDDEAMAQARRAVPRI